MKQSLGNSSFDETFSDPDPNHQTVQGIFSSSFSLTTMNLFGGDIQPKYLGNQMTIISSCCNETNYG